jgi:hypothetical protein
MGGLPGARSKSATDASNDNDEFNLKVIQCIKLNCYFVINIHV